MKLLPNFYNFRKWCRRQKGAITDGLSTKNIRKSQKGQGWRWGCKKGCSSWFKQIGIFGIVETLAKNNGFVRWVKRLKAPRKSNDLVPSRISILMPIWLSVGCLTDGQMKAKGQIKHKCEIVGSVYRPLSNSDGRQRQSSSSQLY